MTDQPSNPASGGQAAPLHRGAASRTLPRALATLGLLAVLGAGLWAALRGSDPLADGRSAYRRGDFDASMDAARAALVRDRTNRDALRLMARSALRLGRDDLGSALYRRLGDAGTEAEDEFLLATRLVRQGQTPTAMALLRQALDRDPDHADSLATLVDLELQLRLFEQARPRANRLADRPGWEARGSLALARIADQQFEPSRAADQYDRVIRLDPAGQATGVEPATLRTRRAESLLRAGRAQEASRVLRDVLAAGPDPEASWLLSRADLQLGRLDAARSALEEAGGIRADRPLAHEPAPYAGAASCAECHAAIHAGQQSSHHARTFARARPDAVRPPDGPVPDPKHPEIVHNLRAEGDRVRVDAKAGGMDFGAWAEYLLGSGHHASTMLVRDDSGTAREYRLSRYAAEGVGWDVTPLHPDTPPDPSSYLGQPHWTDSVHNCLNCHSTDFRAARDGTGPEAADHGIGCERCHGPGGNHLAAVKAGASFPDLAIARPTLATAAARTALCVQCHQAPVGTAPSDVDALRFQWPALGQSRCFTEGGKLDCVTCHSPHRSTPVTAAEYEAKCLDCHAPVHEPSASRDTAPARVACPVSPAGGCLPCHMPTIPDVLPHIPFTDHHIRVRRDGVD